MNDLDYLSRTKIINVKIDDTKGKNLNFVVLKIVISVTIHNIKIAKSLKKKSLLICGIELFINPYLYVWYSGFINAIRVKRKIKIKTPNFLELILSLKYSNPVLTDKIKLR